MRSDDEISASARPGSAFSNGYEWDCWSSRWCDRCVHDDFQTDKFCPIITVAMLGDKTPAEWMEEKPLSLYERYTCIEFRGPDDGPDPEPKPVPDPPDQLLLLPREPYEGVRMLTTAPVAALVSVSVRSDEEAL